MTKNYALFLLNQLCVGASVDAKPIIPQFELAQALSVAIKALEQQPCEDCISRKEVLDMATTIQTDDFSGNEIIEVVDVDDIKELPSVTPTRPTGHWILKRTFPTKMYDEYLNEYECSECHRGIRCTDTQLVNYPYCHCGTRMAESEDKE